MNKAQSTCNCISVGCGGGLSPILACDNFPDSYGPYYIKTYLYFVEPSNAPNAFEDPFDERAALIWENLRSAYSDHRIFFIPGFGGCNPATTYEVIPSDLLPPSGVLTLRDNGFKHSDGIDMYIFRDDIDNGDAYAYCIPSTFFYVMGKDADIEFDDIYSKTQVVSHEMGHSLGLLHTFEVGPGNSCLDTDGSDCQHKGDLVCDTPPDNGQYNEDGDCIPSSLPPQDYSNIMSTFKQETCKDHFTKGQGARMRRYLKQPVGIIEDVRLQDIVITGSVTWNTPMNPNANIIINPGAHLTINAQVMMKENAHIYVRPGDGTGAISGGQLTVYRTITAACDKMWGGIVVEGWANHPQTTLYQGKVFVSVGGVIEHARCGIRAQGLDEETGEPSSYATGGIVSCLWARFNDNTVDVQFGNYQKNVPNASYFSNTQFNTTDEYRGEEVPMHLKLEDVYGIRFNACTFKDERTGQFSDPKTRATGIESDNGGFKVYGSSNFTGLYKGINFFDTNPLVGKSVVGSEFDACFTGIYGTDNDNYVFSDNTYSLSRPGNYTGPDGEEFRGIFLEGNANAFTLSGNIFSYTGGNTSDFFIGTDVLSVGSMNKTIISNDYGRLYIGNRARGLNADTSSGGLIFSGLMYECNNFELNIAHDNIVQDGSIRLEQGQKDGDGFPISSGNEYDEYQSLVAQQFTNLGTGIFYHHITNTPQELFDNFFTSTTITRVPSDPNTACDEEECPPPCDTETELASIKTQFFQQKQAWVTKTTAFPSITDVNQRQAEANAINRLRLSLDRAGSRIILHYALDTAGLKTDSILTWLGRLDSYDADLQLARYYFFSGNYTAADNLLQAIPSTYNLDGDLLAEFEDIEAVLQALRPRLQTGVLLEALPTTLVDSIETIWGADCSAAGALARNILYRNGLRMEAECEETAPRTSKKIKEIPNTAITQPLKLFPNPANDELVIELPKSVACSGIEFIGLADGCSYLHLVPADGTVLKINIASLQSGVYAVVARMADGLILRSKLLIAN